MLEGLQSADAAVRGLTQSWVKTSIARGSKQDALVKMVQPLLMILLEPEAQRRHKEEKVSSKKVTLSREDAERDKKYAKYYFESLGIRNPYAPSRKEQYTDTVRHYSQLLDAGQLLYAIFLLQSVFSVAPQMFVSAAGNVMVDMSMYASSVNGTNASASGFPGPSTQHASGVDRLQSDCGLFGSVSDTSSPRMPNPTLQKSLLELTLSVCSDLLRSEYHPSLDVSVDDRLENLKVKTSSAYLLSAILNELLKILAEQESAGATAGSTARVGVSVVHTPGDFKVFSPYFVSALVALCDLQLVALLLLGKSVEWWREAFLPSAASSNGGSERRRRKENEMWTMLASECSQSGTEGPYSNHLSIIIHSLYTQMLRVVQCLIALDARFSLSLPAGTQHHHHHHSVSQPPNSDQVSIISGVMVSGITSPPTSTLLSSSLPAILPSCSTASQPFFRDFLLFVLLDSSLSLFHDNLLHMFLGSISNLLRHQLLELAPKVIMQLCQNVEMVVTPPCDKKQHCDMIVDTDGSSSNVQLCIVYLNSLLDIILWCLFGKTCGADLAARRTSQSMKSNFSLHYRPSNPLFNIVQLFPTDNAKGNLSPTLKQTSTMSWLLGVFSSSQKGPLSGMGVGGGVGGLGEGGGERGSGGSGEGGLRSLHGVDSLVGQHVLPLLPAVYNTMADVWTKFHSGGDKKLDGSGGGGRDGDRSGGGVRGAAAGAVGNSVKDNLISEVSDYYITRGCVQLLCDW